MLRKRAARDAERTYIAQGERLDPLYINLVALKVARRADF